MTTGESLRVWALQMRALLEMSEMKAMTFRNDAVEYEYILGEGLTVNAADELLVLPESALDEERWDVAA